MRVTSAMVKQRLINYGTKHLMNAALQIYGIQRIVRVHVQKTFGIATLTHLQLQASTLFVSESVLSYFQYISCSSSNLFYVTYTSVGEDEFYCTNDAESMALVPYSQEWEYKTLAE